MTNATTSPVVVTLKPCPFCGGKADRFTIEEPGDNFGGDVISCTSCGASSHVEFGRKENLVSRWNTRIASRAADNAPAPERMPTSPAVVRLVVASRELVFSDHRPSGAPETQAEVELIDLFTELDEATEAFAELVPWDAQPDETLAALEGEG